MSTLATELHRRHRKAARRRRTTARDSFSLREPMGLHGQAGVGVGEGPLAGGEHVLNHRGVVLAHLP